MVIGSYITWNVNGLNAPKDIDQLGGWKHLHECTSPYPITLLDPPPPNCLSLFYIKLIIFPLWLIIIIIFYFLIVKTDKHLSLLPLCSYYSLNTTVSWLANRKVTENSVPPKLPFNRKTCNHLKSRCKSELLWVQMPRYCFLFASAPDVSNV